MPRAHCLLIALLVGGAHLSAGAQGALAGRIAQAPDGVVRLEYDARAGVCGDGRDVVGFRHALFANSFESYGGWSNARCVAGPLRVTLTIADRRAASVRTQVGGAWPAATGRVTDLGTVSSREAAAYFFAQVPRLEQNGRKGRILLPAVLAADAPAVTELLALARDTARTDDTRRQSVQWLGLLDDGAGIPALIDLARTGSPDVRHSAVFWLGQSGDARALRMLHTVIEDSREIERVRAHAIFALAHGNSTAPAEFAYLRGVFPALESTKLKESVLQGMAEEDAGGGRWLLERARDRNEPTKVRRSALFWAGQREATPTSDLVAAYRDLDDAGLREHAIFVISQRDDDAAMEALLRIAREDADRRMRSKALFWLAQKKDDRVTKLISDLLVK